MTELQELLKYNKEALNRREPDFYAVLMSTYELGASTRTVDELIALLRRYLSKEELLKWQLKVFIDMLVETISTFDFQKESFTIFIREFMNKNTLGLDSESLAELIKDNPKVQDYCTIWLAYPKRYDIEKRYN